MNKMKILNKMNSNFSMEEANKTNNMNNMTNKEIEVDAFANLL